MTTSQTQNRLHTFYLLIITQTFSLIGSKMTSFAIGIWVFIETGDTTPLLMVGVFKWIPLMACGSVAGVIADRLNRKALIISSDAAQAVPTLLLILSFATGQFAIWQLYVAAFVQAFFSLVQGPAIGASITMLVPNGHRDRANALMEVAGPSANVLAPVIAGAIYAIVKIEGVMLIDLITFLVAVGVIALVHIPQPAETAESRETKGSIWKELRGGFSFLYVRRGLLLLSVYFLLLNFLTAGIWVLMSPYLLIMTGYNESLVGVLMAISSAGLVVGGVIPVVWRPQGSRIDTILPTLAFAAAALIVFGMARSPLMLGIIVFLMMLPYKFSNALQASIRQTKIPPDMQGRVLGLTSQISIFAMPLALFATGPIVDGFLEPAVGTSHWRLFAPLFGNETGAGIGLYIAACGAIFLVITLITYALPIIRHLERDLPDYEAIADSEPEAATSAPSLVPQAATSQAGD